MAVIGTTTRPQVTINATSFSISNVVRTKGLVTITTSAAHGFVINEQVTVAAVSNTSLNGNWVVTAVPTTTTLQYVQPALPVFSDYYTSAAATPLADITSGADTGTVLQVRHVSLPNGRDYTTTAATQIVTLSLAEFQRLDFSLVGAAPKLLTDSTP